MSKKIKTNNSNNYDASIISLFDIILFFTRQLKIIIISPAILCIITIINVTLFVDPVFTSTSKIMSSSNSSGTSQAVGIAAQLGLNIPTSKTDSKWVYPEIIKSRTLARYMLKRKFYTNKFDKNKSLFGILLNENNKKQFSDKEEIVAVNKFLKMVSLSEDSKTGILTLRVDSFEPDLSAKVNQAIIEELNEYQEQNNKSKTSDARRFIEERIASVEKELRLAEDSLRKFNDRNRRIENSPALQLQEQRLSREVTVLIGVFTTLKQQLETTKIEEVKKSDYAIVLDPPEVPLKKSKPNKKLAVVLSGILGLGLGMFLGLLKEYFDSSSDEEKIKFLKAKSLFRKNISNLLKF